MKAKHFVCVDSKTKIYSFYEGNKHIVSTWSDTLTPEWLEKYRQNYAMLLADITPPSPPEAA